MTERAAFPAIPTSNKTEWKVKAAALGTWSAALAGSIAFSTFGTDYVHALPDWAENIVYPSLLAGITWLTGRAARTRPDFISQSTADAVERKLRERAESWRRN